jgi:segregation and condensation protein A
MTSLAQNAITLLIDLAERGEIDPWDVQVIEVIDRFLSQIQTASTAVPSTPSAYEADLSQSGQAFLYASMLVLLKADSLAREAEAAQNQEAIDVLEPEVAETTVLPLRLERQIRRRAVARPPQNRRVTLQELIAQLELMAAAVAEQKPRVRSRRPLPQSRSQALRTIAELAHQENLSEVATAIEQFLQERWQQICQGQDWMDFERLIEQWSAVALQKMPEAPAKTADHSPNGDRVAVFWALLFLSAQSKVELSQEEFYQDLKIRSLSTSAFAHPDLAALALLE